MDEDFQSRLEARLARLQDETGLTGVTVAVMTDGQVAGVAAAGERRRSSGIPVTVDDRRHDGLHPQPCIRVGIGLRNSAHATGERSVARHESRKSLGAGGGVTIESLAGPGGRLGLDIGLRYLTGGDVDYLTRGDLQRDETGVTFEPTRSPASLFVLQIGITVDF